jgi:predicted RNA methylase
MAHPVKVLKTLPESAYSTLLPYQAPQVRDILNIIFAERHPKKIVDLTAHIGGDTIHFAETFPGSTITAIDIDPLAVECLKINVDAFVDNPSRITIVTADSTQWIVNKGEIADLYYLDPPWGGPQYSLEKEIPLFLGGLPIAETINNILDRKLASKIILKIPRNFAYMEFRKSVHGETRIYFTTKAGRGNNIISYGLVLITP